MEPRNDLERIEVRTELSSVAKSTNLRARETASHGLAASGEQSPVASDRAFAHPFAYPSLHCRAFWVKNKPDLNRDRLNRFPALRNRGGLVKSYLGSSAKSLFLIMTVLAAGSALAANKGSLNLQHPTAVAGKQLPEGSYTVQWDGSGDQVDVKIYQGKNLVASTPAKVLKVDHPAGSNSAVVVANSDKTYSLSEIRFANKKFALGIMSDGGSGMGAGGGSGN